LRANALGEQIHVIEQLMILALGFLFAGLLALAFAPAFWRRANRLTRRRLETQVPLSVQEILAERDQLRAEFAVEQRRLELRLAQTNVAHAADRGELGRRAAEISALQDELAQRAQETHDHSNALAQAEAALSQMSAELGAATKALYDAESLNERKQDELAKLAQAHEAITALAEERLANHAAADARAIALELRLGDVSRRVLEAEGRFAERTTQAAKLNDALALAKRDLDFMESNYVSLQKKLESETARAAHLAHELDALRAQRNDEQGKMRALTAQGGVREASAAEDASRREQKIRAVIEKAREAERVLTEKHERLQSEYAALQGALEVARRRCETLEANLAAQRATRQEGGTIVRLPRTSAEPNNGTEASAEIEPPSPRAPTQAATPDTEAKKIEMHGQVGT
jgi:chromosome segregation ATPase